MKDKVGRVWMAQNALLLYQVSAMTRFCANKYNEEDLWRKTGYILKLTKKRASEGPNVPGR